MEKLTFKVNTSYLLDKAAGHRLVIGHHCQYLHSRVGKGSIAAQLQGGSYHRIIAGNGAQLPAVFQPAQLQRQITFGQPLLQQNTLLCRFGMADGQGFRQAVGFQRLPGREKDGKALLLGIGQIHVSASFRSDSSDKNPLFSFPLSFSPARQKPARYRQRSGVPVRPSATPAPP